MKEIVSLEETINSIYMDVIYPFEFTIIEQREFSGGALIKYSGRYFQIEFTNDRGIIEVGVGPLEEEWIVGVENINAFLTLKELGRNVSAADRKLIIAKRLGHNEQAAFLKTSYEAIGAALSPSNSAKTRKPINEHYEERWGFGMYEIQPPSDPS